VKPGFPFSKAAFSEQPDKKPKLRRSAKKSAPDDRNIAAGNVRQRSDKFARGGSAGGKKGAVTNIVINGVPAATHGAPGLPFAAPPRAAGPVGPAPGASPMGGGFKTGGKVAGAYPGSSGAAVNNALTRSESTGSDLRKWTKPRQFTDKMTAGALSGEGRLEKADHARKKK
jgi:hypothetical protein